MERLKFYKIIIGALLLLNIGTLAFLWSHRPPPPGARGPFMFLVKETGMDEAQQASYAQLRDAHRAQVDGYQAQNSQLRQQMFGLLASHTPNDPAVQALADSIASFKRKEELLTYEHFSQVRALCSPEQQVKFDAAIGAAIQAMAPPPHRRQ